MVIVNSLANILLINGMRTEDISDSYPNLFAPAGITFSIWGIIYLLLFVYLIYQLGLIGKYSSRISKEKFNTIGLYFVISSLANTLWIFLWHYDLISLTVIPMLIILLSLIRISKETTGEYWMVSLPFSVYYGWITVATIANLTIFLVSIGWGGFSLSEGTWMVIILLVGTIIGSSVVIKNKDIPYGLVFLWAYTGIVINTFLNRVLLVNIQWLSPQPLFVLLF
ncbi:hypothetical protein SAMN03080614_100930 [Anaerobranca gottschalkii DSM 13577]|uniref:TspO and MBR related proteins n=2 Tax=Anaerobranca gottschalkii TaxID=108328 RepID=A0A1H9ZH03_9FIRM|nr:hypothetical protein SAMN03080614_100930 [Anaerobranca gottschalkii DSM 13577]